MKNILLTVRSQTSLMFLLLTSFVCFATHFVSHPAYEYSQHEHHSEQEQHTHSNCMVIK